MSDLLSSPKWAKFRGAIKSVTDTFANTPVIIRKRKDTLSAFNQSRKETTTFEDFTYNAVRVQIGTGTDAKNQQAAKGSFDNSDGYILINYEEFFAGGLISANGDHIINEGSDTLVMYGKEHTITGVDLLGPIEGEVKGQEAIVKIHFNKTINKFPNG